MNIINLKINEIKPYEKNPRQNDQAVKAVAESIKQFGFQQPIVVDKNKVIIVGHTRHKAAKKLGLEEVPCVIADNLTEKQVKKYRLADNKVGELAEWDEELLWAELQDIGIGEGMEDFGFDEADFNIEDDDIEVEEDFYEPELPKEPKAKRGDIYQLGEHRLMCGDCTDENAVDALMDGQEADLCITDPPYNVALGMNATPEEMKKRRRRTDGLVITNDEMSDDQFYAFLCEFYTQMLRSLKPGGVFYIWHADSEGHNFRNALREAGGRSRQCLIWNKNALVLGRQDYHWKHEPCLYGWKEGAGHYFIDDRAQSTVWEDRIDVDKLTKEEMKALLKDIFEDRVSTTVMNESKPSDSKQHPTMKPIKLIGRQIKNSSKKGWCVIDFFGGSGSTLIAAEQLGRKCYMMELDEKYVDVIIDRWEQLTGQKAVKINGKR